MPRRVPRDRNYDEVFVDSVIEPDIRFTQRDIDKIRTAIKKRPSAEFLRAFEVILSLYKVHRKAVTSSSPASIQRRVQAAVDVSNALQEALGELTSTDIGIFDAEHTDIFLRDAERISLAEFRDESLPRFQTLAKRSLRLIAREPKHGAMRDYAQRSLATSLCQLLFEETGTLPKASENENFDMLLRFALHHADQRQRKDVRDLMVKALAVVKKGPSLASMPPWALLLTTLGKRRRRK